MFSSIRRIFYIFIIIILVYLVKNTTVSVNGPVASVFVLKDSIIVKSDEKALTLQQVQKPVTKEEPVAKEEVKKETSKPKTNTVKKEQKKKTTTVNNNQSINRLSGSLTGYSADCPACSGKLACASGYNVYKNDVVTYSDKTYGSVRIVASSKNLPCGSIVKFSFNGNETVAIVLDRGVTGNNLDLLVRNEKEAYNSVGRKSITYDVLRRGW